MKIVDRFEIFALNTLNKFGFKSIKQADIRQFIKYFIVGFTTFLLDFTLFTLFDALLVYNLSEIEYKFGDNVPPSYLIANTTGYTIVFFYNFLLSRLWSFKSKGDLKGQIIKFGILFLFNVFLTGFLLYVLTDIVGISKYISKGIVMALLVCWNYIIYRKIIFK